MRKHTLCAVFLLFSVATSIANAEDAKPKKRSNVLIAVRKIQGNKYGVAVFNMSSKSIMLGGIRSALGFDQFRFRAKTDNGDASVKRKGITISGDRRDPLIIPSGSYYEYSIDLGDGTWAITGGKVDSWTSIMVSYDPGWCNYWKERKKIGLHGSKLQSKWVAITK